jgi:hypothetical protein
VAQQPRGLHENTIACREVSNYIFIDPVIVFFSVIPGRYLLGIMRFINFKKRHLVLTSCNTPWPQALLEWGPTDGAPPHMGPYSGDAGGIRRYPTEKKVT